MIALSLVWWPGYVRLLQAKTLALKQETYVEAARAVGTGRLRIVFVHILPNCVSPIMVKASMDMGTAILAAASLGFIGLGAQPPHPEWGAMISHGRNYLPTWWWYSAFPGVWRSTSPCSASTCSATVCATCSIPSHAARCEPEPRAGLTSGHRARPSASVGAHP